MWCRSYRNHVIMAFPSFDTATGLWAPQANITWVVGPMRESEFIRFPKRVLSEDDAADCAARAARTWIDRRLRALRHAPPRRYRPLAVAAATDRATQPAGAKVTPNAKPSSAASRMLSFHRFKSMMRQSGVTVSDERLQKSYTALLELRRRNHSSWTEIKNKMAQSQARIANGETHGRKLKGDRLPLTLRDWRRII